MARQRNYISRTLIFDFIHNKYYTFENFQYLYQIPDSQYLRYLQLINSIPKTIRSKLISSDITQPSEFKSMLDNLNTKTKLSKYLYNTFIKNNSFEPTHKQKWIDQFKDTTFNWNEVYNMPYIATIDTLIQSFQYKIINRTIPTNKFLFKCELTCSTLCNFCSCNSVTNITIALII